MRRVVLISCVKKKLDQMSKARDIYTSTLFRYMLKYAEHLNPDFIFILSAKYGLLNLNDVIEPYSVTLNEMQVDLRRIWADKVINKLKQTTNIKKDEFIILAGAKYREFIASKLDIVKVPMNHLSIGEQLHFLKEALNE